MGCSPKCDVNIERKIFFLLITDFSDLSDGGRAVSHRTSHISTISQIRILFATHDSSLFLITDFSDLSDRGGRCLAVARLGRVVMWGEVGQ